MGKKAGESVEIHLNEIAQPMSDQERLQRCNEEIARILDQFGCQIEALPQSQVQGSILIVGAVSRLVIRPR